MTWRGLRGLSLEDDPPLTYPVAASGNINRLLRYNTTQRDVFSWRDLLKSSQTV